jgi:transposase
MPFIDAEQLDEAYLPPAKYHALQRLTRQRERLMKGITTRKNRIGSIINGYLPGLRKAFSNEWSVRARAFYRQRLNPYGVVREGERALETFLASVKARGALTESHHLYQACQKLVEFYNRSKAAGMVNEGFFDDLQDEIACELRLMETEEAEVERVSKRIEELYRHLHPSDHLRSIPGIGVRTAQVFMALVGDPHRFRSQAAFANWTGVVPGARQSADTEGKGLRMTKAGPSMMKRALFQAGDIARRYDPQLADLYYREMVHHGKTHLQAMGAVMSHLAARILVVLRESRPY